MSSDGDRAADDMDVMKNQTKTVTVQEDAGSFHNPGIEDELTTARVYESQESQLSKWETFKKFPFSCYCVGVMIWTLNLTSFDIVAGGIVLSISQFRKHFGYQMPDGSYVVPAKWIAAFSGGPLGAQIVGQYFSSFLSDQFGKKWIIIISLIFSAGFIGVEVAASNLHTFLIGKTLNGVCLGVIQSICVSYVSDTVPLVLRGIGIALCNISFSTGPMVVYIINYCLSDKDEDDQWAYKATFSAQWGFTVVSLIGLIFVPESPYYYIFKNKSEMAYRALQKLYKDPEASQEQHKIIKATVDQSREIAESTSYIDLFKGLNRIRTWISVMPFLILPNCGIYFTAAYTTYYFQLSGYDDRKSFRFTLGQQIISLVGCVVALFFVDSVGRRSGFLYGLGILIVFDFIIGIAVIYTHSQHAVNTTIAFMMFYGGTYNTFIGSLVYPVCAENPTSYLRSKTIALGLALTNVMNMLWSFVFPYLFNPDKANLGAKSMLIFGGISIVSWIYLFFFQTETANRSYEEIDEMYANKVPFRKFDSYVSKKNAINQEVVQERIRSDHSTNTA
ncbi:unnamed protein product [Wickerhamomyces anomalus]